MNCPRCGNILADGTPQCPSCGTMLMGGPPGPAGMPPMPPYGAPGYGMGGAPVMPRTSGMAIAGFVLSFFCSLLGLIFSIIGYNECKKSNGSVTGEGLALAGIIISILGMLLGLIIMASGSGHRY
jgi:Domain of unknown function (DUF4190)